MTATKDVTAIGRALKALDASPTGRPYAQDIRDGHIQIIVEDADVFSRDYPGAYAAYEPAGDLIKISRDALSDPKRAAVVLAHETQHWVDLHASSPAHLMLRQIGHTAVQSVIGVAHLGNPVSGFLSGVQASINETEVTAYMRQAKICREIGTHDWGFGTGPNGEILTRAQTRDQINHSPLYLLENRRVGTGSHSLPVRSTLAVPVSLFFGLGTAYLAAAVLRRANVTIPSWGRVGLGLEGLAVAGALFCADAVKHPPTPYDL